MGYALNNGTESMQVQPNSSTRFGQYLTQQTDLFRQVLQDHCIHTRTYLSGECLLQQGQSVEHLYLVAHGRISMNITVSSGKRFQLGEVECEEHIFGEIEFFTQMRCQWNVVAEQELDAMVISAASLEKSMLEHPELSLFFACALAEDYQDSLDIYTQRLLWPIVYNIAHDLWQRHQNKTGIMLHGFAKVDSEAERFGTSSRVYRRAVKSLIDQGFIEKEGSHLKIRNEAKLQAFLNQEQLSF